MADRRKALLLRASFALALAWRLAAFWLQRRAVAAGALERPAASEFAAFSVMGLVFLMFGWIAYRRAHTPASWAFSMYAALTALHWGGPLTFDAPGWLVYFLLSGVLAEVLFLHFALIYPRPIGAARRGTVWWLLYGAAGVAALLTVVVLLGAKGLQTVALLVNHTLLPNLFALAAIVLLGVRLARATPQERTATGLRVAFWGVVAGILPYLGVLAIQAAGAEPPGGAELYNGFFLLIPAALCAAVVRDSRTAEA